MPGASIYGGRLNLDARVIKKVAGVYFLVIFCVFRRMRLFFHEQYFHNVIPGQDIQINHVVPKSKSHNLHGYFLTKIRLVGSINYL